MNSNSSQRNQVHSQDFPKGVLNSADAFLTDKNHRLRQCLATFDSAHLPVYDYSHYIVKRH